MWSGRRPKPHSHLIPSSPPTGQRCTGRNFNGRRCCTPQEPCGLGEGDCDGPGDGGGHDGHEGCEGYLVCGSNNCKKFGHYYHEKDDCCDLPPPPGPVIPVPSGWGSWGRWETCRYISGSCKSTRTRFCQGNNCRHSRQSQDRVCGPGAC